MPVQAASIHNDIGQTDRVVATERTASATERWFTHRSPVHHRATVVDGLAIHAPHTAIADRAWNAGGASSSSTFQAINLAPDFFEEFPANNLFNPPTGGLVGVEVSRQEALQ